MNSFHEANRPSMTWPKKLVHKILGQTFKVIVLIVFNSLHVKLHCSFRQHFRTKSNLSGDVSALGVAHAECTKNDP